MHPTNWDERKALVFFSLTGYTTGEMILILTEFEIKCEMSLLQV